MDGGPKSLNAGLKVEAEGRDGDEPHDPETQKIKVVRMLTQFYSLFGQSDTQCKHATQNQKSCYTKIINE